MLLCFEALKCSYLMPWDFVEHLSRLACCNLISSSFIETEEVARRGLRFPALQLFCIVVVVRLVMYITLVAPLVRALRKESPSPFHLATMFHLYAFIVA